MLSALIYAEEDSKRENERRAAWPRRGLLRNEEGERGEGEQEKAEEREERPGGPHCRIRSHVIGIVDSILRLSALRRNRLPPPDTDRFSLLPSLTLSPIVPFVAATHARSRGYVVEPPRGHRIIIGWQVTRTLSPGFNWPIIVARIDGAADPDRRETFGVACSPSDTTRLSVTNISWQ